MEAFSGNTASTGGLVTFRDSNWLMSIVLITSMFMPRLKSDHPLPVPPNCRDLAFISQSVEIPDEVVFTVEHSVRAAQTAVYQLLGIKHSIPPITRHDKSISVLIHTLGKAFA